MSAYKPLSKTSDGRMICNPHRTTGAPRFHTDGCFMCEAARAKGIVRPNASDFTSAQRRALALRGNPEDAARSRKNREARKTYESAIVPGRCA